MRETTQFIHAIVLVAIMGVVTGCDIARQLELQTSQFVVSQATETQLGAEYSQQIEGEIEILNDPEITAWVNEMGRKLIEYSPPSPQEFTFKVTTSEEVNAFAIPGGYCYVNVGLIKLANNEAEVAAVVGHEINHVTTRHGARSMQRALGVQLVSDLVSAENTAAQLVGALNNVGGALALRKFGRDDEREADELGVEAMYQAGYDPRAAVTFFEKLRAWAEEQGASEGGLMTQLTSTHPATTERINSIRDQISQYQLHDSLILDTPQFQSIQARLKSQ